MQHGHRTTPEIARVPFVLAAPGLVAGERGDLVGHVDVAPTLLALAGLDGLPEPEGLSLGSVPEGSPEIAERIVFCTGTRDATAYTNSALARAVWYREDTLVPSEPKLSGRVRGPNGWAQRLDPQLEQSLRAFLSERVPVLQLGKVDGEIRAQLRSLGYLPPEAPASGGQMLENRAAPDAATD